MKIKMKFSKQILSVLLCLAMLISYVPMTAYAASSGACGDGVNWTLTDDGVLTISGSGVIPDYRFVNKRPYYSITSQIKEIVIESGVTAIGNLAFSGCENLKKLTIKGDITRIGARAFAQCSAITEITYCGVNAPSDLGTNIWVNGLDISVAVPENYAVGVETFANLSVSRTLPATGGEAETPTYEVKIVGHTTDTGVAVKSIISDGVPAERATHGKDLAVVLEITGEGTVDEVYVRYIEIGTEGYYLADEDCPATLDAETLTVTIPGNLVDGTVAIDTGIMLNVIVNLEGGYLKDTNYGKRWYDADPSDDVAALSKDYAFYGYGGSWAWNDCFARNGYILKEITSNLAQHGPYDPDRDVGPVLDRDMELTLVWEECTEHNYVNGTCEHCGQAQHTHNWTYTVNDAKDTIAATCTADGCTNTNGGSVKLVAPTELTYNGTAKEATFQFDNWQLGDDAKPTISYNDTDKVAVTNKDIVATITLGVESASVTYKVKPASISGATVTADTVNYTGSAQTPDVSVVLNGKTLVKDTDYTVSYNNNTNAGTATVTVTGTGNYEGTATGTFTITDTAEPTGAILIKDNTWLQFLNNITFGLFFKENVDVIVTADGTGSAVDKVEYLFSSTELNKNNLPADGWKTVEGNNGTYTFAITAQNKGAVYVKITDAYGNVAVINSDGIVVYTDSKAVDTEVTYTYKENSNKDIAVEFNGNTVNSIVYGEKVLAANTDYSVDYESGKIVLKATYLDTLNAGDYTYTVSYNPMGVENSGVTDLTTTFTVKVEPTSIAGATVNVSGTFTYDGNAKTPDPVVVLNGETLVKDRDYTVSYAENVNAGTATVTVTGKGNYSGTASGSFRIERAKLTDISVQQNGKLPYDGGKALTPAVTANATALNGAKVYFIYSADGSAYGSMPTFTDAGTYTVYYCAYTVDNNFFDHHDTFTVTIDKATVTEPTIASKSYSGSAQTADVPASDLYTVEKNNGGTEEGSYDVVLKLKDSANYKWSTTDTSEVTLQFVISAAQNAWDTNPSISGWTYGEAAKTPVGTAKYGDVKVVYTGKANNGTNYNSETAPTKAGNYTATFTVTGTEDYSGLSEQVNFTIAKKAVTVTANDASKTYGESDPALTYTHTELVGSDALIITVARASGENANTYTITASQAEGANPNYEITFKTGIFTIQKAALSVTAEDKTITYGDEVPAYTVRYEGFKNGDDKDDLGGTLDFYSYYRQFDDVGEYDICPHGLESDNYVFFYYFGKLTVNAKPITVTIQNATSVYGDTLAELKATDNGIVNGDTNVYSLATTATGTSNVGKYAITGTALDSNYNVTFVNGEYEITKREITITVDAKNTVVNTTLPTYTYKVEGLVGVDTLVTEPTLTCNANIALIGEYDITASGADAGGNYSIKYVPAKLTVLTDNAVDAAAGYTEELKDYDPATVTSEDKAELDEMLSEINTILADETTTDNGKKALEEVKEQIEKLIKEINDAADATNTENVGKVENVTPENVTPENKTDLENAKADLEKALEENSGNYTEDEKKAIEDELGRIDDALEVIGNVEAVEKVISKLPSVDTVKPDDEEAIKAITDAQTAYNALSDYEKSLLDEAAKANLDKLVAALVAYDIVEGDGSSWTEDSDHNITFVVNGLFGKFVGIKVDGKDVDKANYEVKAGSTIITLKASYLDTLAVGEHTITVVYTDGSTDGTFNVHAKANSPATGDNSNMFLWIALLFISGGAVITLTVVERKKRMASKR